MKSANPSNDGVARPRLGSICSIDSVRLHLPAYINGCEVGIPSTTPPGVHRGPVLFGIPVLRPQVAQGSNFDPACLLEKFRIMRSAAPYNVLASPTEGFAVVLSLLPKGVSAMTDALRRSSTIHERRYSFVMHRAIWTLLLAGCVAPWQLNGADFVPVFLPCPSQRGVPVRSIRVRAMTRDLKAMEDLQAANFAVTEHRAPQTVCGFSHFHYPISVGILLDTSGSMRGARLDAFGLAKAGLNRFLEQSGPQDEYFLEFTNPKPAVRYGFTSDLASMRRRLDVKPYGPTALFDAIYLALNAMQKARFETRVLLVISDALDNESVYLDRDLEEAFSKTPVPMFLIVIADPLRREIKDPYKVKTPRETLIRLAFKTGGYATVLSHLESMSAVGAELGRVIRSVYTLYVRESTSGNTAPQGELRVELRGTEPRARALYGTTVSSQ